MLRLNSQLAKNLSYEYFTEAMEKESNSELNWEKEPEDFDLGNVNGERLDQLCALYTRNNKHPVLGLDDDYNPRAREVRRKAAKSYFWLVLSEKLNQQEIEKKEEDLNINDYQKAYKDTMDEIGKLKTDSFITDIFAGGSYLGSTRTCNLVKLFNMDPDRKHTRAAGLFGYRWSLGNSFLEKGGFRKKLIDPILEIMHRATIEMNRELTGYSYEMTYKFSFISKEDADKCADDLVTKKIVEKLERPETLEEESKGYYFRVDKETFKKIRSNYVLSPQDSLIKAKTETYRPEGFDSVFGQPARVKNYRF
jgi:hypothetical protein